MQKAMHSFEIFGIRNQETIILINMKKRREDFITEIHYLGLMFGTPLRQYGGSEY